MNFIRTTSGLPEALAKTLTSALEMHSRVIWLIPGGSNIAISVAASRLLDEDLTKKLIIIQTDERYVALDSPDCNWHQLVESGLVIGQAIAYPMLIPGETSLEMAESRYKETLRREFEQADCIVGQFGIGPDGHTAGIKPHSPASLSRDLVSGYQAEDFVRLTMTLPAIRHVDIAEVFAFGDTKRPILEQLTGSDSPPLEELPSGIFREIKQCNIYNDQIESEE